MLMAHRIALVLNNKQATYFARAAGTARFAYNCRALAQWQKQYAAWRADNSLPKPDQYALHQLTYKAALSGGEVQVADRFFASSKLCSCCGHRLSELALSVRQWVCPECGAAHDRERT